MNILNINLDSKVYNPILKSELKITLQECLAQNYVKFNNKCYTQNDGLPIGSPLSSLLVDIFIDNFENQIFTTNVNHTRHCWYRFVDRRTEKINIV